MPTNFFNLPRELRDQVYYELWECTPCIKIAGSCDWSRVCACYTVKARKADGMPLWLLTCKQVLTEATEEFKIKGIWVIDADMTPELASIQSLPSRGEVQRLEFITEDVVYRSRHSAFGSESALATTHYVLGPGDLSYLASALNFFEKSGNMREFSIQCCICSDEGEDDDVLEVDLSGINGARLVNIHLKTFYVIVHQCWLELSEALKESCFNEVKKLGISAVGADVTPIMKEDRTEIKFIVNHPRISG
jgi:hypothetical protein